MKEELIRKFLRNECSPEEAEQVSKYLKEHPGELERHMGYADWQNDEREYAVDPAFSEKMRKEIISRTGGTHRRFHYRKFLAAAASVALLAFISIALWLQYTGPDNRTGGKNNLAARQESGKDFLIIKSNTGGEIMLTTLPDGSAVELDTGSRISYYHTFGKERRDVFLEGGALFEVAEDKQRPFTVYAGNVATTALGTVFRVSATRESGETIVRLLSGKVIVKPDSLLSAHGLKEVYLSPGKELTVNIKQFTSTLKHFRKAAPKAPEPVKKPVLKPGIVDINDTMIVFKQHPLPLVLKDLEELYRTPLYFEEESGLRKILFTGEYRRHKESLEQILNSIALLNELEIIRDKEGYRIEKK